MKFFEKNFRDIFETIQIVIIILTVLLIFFSILKLFAPIITVFTILLFTSFTLNRRINTIMSIGGIALYAASWSAVEMWGTTPGLLVWAFGVLVWFMAVSKSLSYHPATVSG